MDTVLCGIDYSLTCPCICLHTGNSFSLSNCKFYYLNSKKKFQIYTGKFLGFPHKIYKTEEERFEQLADFIVDKIPNGAKVYIEGFSFGSTGHRLFEIAGASYILRYKLYLKGIDFIVVSPKTIKKYATGNGNSSKLPMYEAFEKETGFNLLKELNIKEAGGNPESDIVDSFYIAKYGFYAETKI